MVQTEHKKITRLSYIHSKGLVKQVPPGEFRLELFLEDIVVDSVVYVEPTRLKDQLIPEDREEPIGIMFDMSIPVSNFGIYYHRPIDNLDNKYFEVLVERIMWMNEGIDFDGLKRVVEHIYSKWIKDKGSISKRSILKKILDLTPIFDTDENNITHSKSVFYKRNSLLSPAEKMKLTIKYRDRRISYLVGEIIHESAMIAMENHRVKDKLLRLGKKAVLQEVQTKKAIATVRTMLKHMHGKTATAIVEYNVNKVFKTEKAYNKYKKFLTLPSNAGNREVSRRLGISLSTVQQYKELRDGQ